MMTRGRPQKYTRRHRAIIEVLFLHGLSGARIARIMPRFGAVMSVGQVNGQITALGYRKSEMPRAVRQRFLDRIKANPPAELPASFFTAMD